MQCHCSGQLQIIDLLLKTITHLSEISDCLSVLRKSGALCLLAQSGELHFQSLLQLLLACKNIHGQFLKVDQIQLIHLIQHGSILQQRDLMLLQFLGDSVDICLSLVIFCLHGRELVPALLEESEESFALLLITDRPQLTEHGGQHISNLSEILGADASQS